LPDGRQELTLSGGDKLVVDMYIPTFGVQPNSSYVPTKFLDTNGFVKVDEYLSVKGTEGIFAIGDISNAEPPQFWFVEKQSTYIAKNVILTLSGKPPIPYNVATSGM
jgi:apoptosis-inducing factor 2